MSTGTVYYVTQAVPTDEQHGGNHRAHQIMHDLEAVINRSDLVVLSLPAWRRSRPPQFRFHPAYRSRVQRAGSRIVRWMAKMAENPLRLLSGTEFSVQGTMNPDFLRSYERLLQRQPGKKVMILEHTGYGELIAINKKYGVPTISCAQNIESFDVLNLDFDKHLSVYATLADFAQELRVLSQCSTRLAISRVEAGLLGGLGLPCEIYPYRPVAGLRERLLRIRRLRAGQRQRNQFVMLGNADHYATGKSFEWFISNVLKAGLPQNVEVLVAGAGTERLARSCARISGLKLLGWLEEDVLDHLLVQAKGVLVPQRLGFGSLTRLPELACAGIPVFAAAHPVYAIDPTPGLEIVDNDRESWLGAMQRVVSRTACTMEEYSIWEDRQVNPLEKVLAQTLNKSRSQL